MDGLTLLRALRQDMAESNTSTWPDVRTSYDYLYKAAIATANRSGVLTGSKAITTIASRAYYPLPPEYLRLYLMNDQNQYFIKYNDGDTDYWLNFVEYDSVVLANLTTGVPVPQEFSIRTSEGTYETNIGGTTTANGATTITGSGTAFTTRLVVGDSISLSSSPTSYGIVTAIASDTSLTVGSVLGNGTSQTINVKHLSGFTPINGTCNNTATFITGTSYTIFGQTLGECLLGTTSNLATVKVGDIVHNTTDGSHGLVISLLSSSLVVCAMFDGTLNYFTSGDSFVIIPQTTYEIYLNPPPLYNSDTVTVQYVYSPLPVYSAYKNYPFHRSLTDPIVDYAHWLYKYRDEKPEFGNILYQKWLMGIREGGNMVNQAKQRHRGYKVNLIKRADRSWTYRR